MPDLCGAFLHDIDLATELQTRGHQIVFLTIKIPREGYNGGYYRGFRFVHYTAASSFLDTSEVWICPHSPILPDVRKINSRGYNRPIVATCHFDGNYNMIRANGGTGWAEMLLFINSIMEVNYRKNIVPWPPQIRITKAIRPLMHRTKIEITEPFQGDAITLVNANMNKGVTHFIEIARRMPDRKFLGVLPYYGELRPPIAPPNVEWVPFSDDIRTILKRTRILLVPSYYESFGRIAVEAMLNGIPTVYSLPSANSIYPGGTSEGLHEWISPAGIGVNRETIDEWTKAIVSLDDPEAYRTKSDESREHVEAMKIFEEASRISDMVETFTRQNPVQIRSSQQIQQAQRPAGPPEVAKVREPMEGRLGGFGFSNGRLRIQR